LAILVMFGVELVTGAWRNETILVRLGAIIPTLFADGQYWRLIAAMFLHGDGTPKGDAMHLGANLLSLLQIGSLYEAMFGTRRFLFMYFATGIIASTCSAAHFLMQHIDGASVGASGAIFGVLGAFIFSIWLSPRYRHDPNARWLIPQFLFWIAVNIGIGFYVKEIDNSAHLGGLIAGLLLGFIPHRVPPPPPGQAVVDIH
jgi:rhomboid protease GluP